MNERIRDSLCVGRRRAQDRDEDVFLFLVLDVGERLTGELIRQVKGRIREALSARHVPRFVIPVKEVPMTVNGKKVETLVKQVISTGEFPKKISSTVVNRGCLQDFKQYYHVEERAVRAKL